MIENALKAKYNSSAVTLGYRVDENKDYQFDPIAAPARHKAEEEYLLATKLFCGCCERMMIGESCTSAHTGAKIESWRAIFSPWESPWSNDGSWYGC